MAMYDSALKAFITKFGEDAVESALVNYENQRERSKKASAKAQEQRRALSQMISKSKADPKLAELLKQHGIVLGQ